MRKTLLLISGILLLALALRLFRLNEIPPGLTHDEANHGREAVEILDGVLRYYFPLNYGSEPLYSYTVAGSMALMGENVYALRRELLEGHIQLESENGDEPTDVESEPVPLEIVKSDTTPSPLPEPGGDFTYSVTVTNPSTVDTATLTDIDDDWAGVAPLTDSGSQDLQSACVDSSDVAVTFPYDLVPLDFITCEFTQEHLGNAGDEWTDAVTVVATDDDVTDQQEPENEEEEQACRDAMEECPTEAIGETTVCSPISVCGIREPGSSRIPAMGLRQQPACSTRCWSSPTSGGVVPGSCPSPIPASWQTWRAGATSTSARSCRR